VVECERTGLFQRTAEAHAIEQRIDFGVGGRVASA
jgi:hypothetical protein